MIIVKIWKDHTSFTLKNRWEGGQFGCGKITQKMIAELQKKVHVNLDQEGDGGCKKKCLNFQDGGSVSIFLANTCKVYVQFIIATLLATPTLNWNLSLFPCLDS